MMGRARASGEAQAMGVAVAFFKCVCVLFIDFRKCFVKIRVFIKTKKARTANTNKTAVLTRRDLFSRPQWWKKR